MNHDAHSHWDSPTKRRLSWVTVSHGPVLSVGITFPSSAEAKYNRPARGRIPNFPNLAYRKVRLDSELLVGYNLMVYLLAYLGHSHYAATAISPMSRPTSLSRILSRFDLA